MQTHLTQSGDVTVVKVSGRLDINQAGMFRQACLSRLTSKKVVFHLAELTFVGSTGIQSFFQTVHELHIKAPFGVRIVGLHHDFQRILLLRPELMAPCLNHLAEAMNSFQSECVPPGVPSESSRTS